MGSRESFAEILARKIEKEVEKRLRAELQIDKSTAKISPQPPPPFIFDTIASLMGQVSRKDLPLKSKAQVYHQFRPKNPRPRQSHNLNVKQIHAWNFFAQFGCALNPGFTLSEVRRAYRQLSLKLHPDRQGGSTHQFLALKEAFDCLKTVFA